jgi:glutaredoxin-related protein
LAAEKLLRSGAIDWPTFCKLEENERTYERKKTKAKKGSPKTGLRRRQGSADEADKAFTLVKSLQPDSPATGPPPPTVVTLWTSSAKGRQISTEEDRIRLILDAKMVNYEVVLVDDNVTLQRKMTLVSRLTRLPQLHIQGIYYGDASVIQEMEDTGELNLLLQNATRKSQYGTETPQIAYNDIYRNRDSERKKIAAKRITSMVKQRGKQLRYGTASPLVDRLEQLRLRKATLQLELRRLEEGVMVDTIDMGSMEPARLSSTSTSTTGTSPRSAGERRSSPEKRTAVQSGNSQLVRGKKGEWMGELGANDELKKMNRGRSFMETISGYTLGMVGNRATGREGAQEVVDSVGRVGGSKPVSPDQNAHAEAVGRSLERSRVLRGEGVIDRGETPVSSTRASSRVNSPSRASEASMSTPPAWERPPSNPNTATPPRSRTQRSPSTATRSSVVRLQKLVRKKNARKRLEQKAHEIYERLYDPETGLDYYYNKHLDISSWEKPRSLGATQLPLTLE